MGLEKYGKIEKGRFHWEVLHINICEVTVSEGEDRRKGPKGLGLRIFQS